MTEAIIRINDPSNWEQRFEVTVDAAPAPLGRYYQIEPFFIPLLFQSPVLAIGTSTTDANSKRQLACWARQVITSGSGIRGQVQVDQKRNYLNTIHAHRFELFAADYQLKIAVPWYLRNLTIAIWEYVGAIDEDFDIIRQSLNRIETKVDAL